MAKLTTDDRRYAFELLEEVEAAARTLVDDGHALIGLARSARRTLGRGGPWEIPSVTDQRRLGSVALVAPHGGQ